MSTSPLQLPAELWLQVFNFLSWRDKLSVRCTCAYFRKVLDASRPHWYGFCVVLRKLSRYNRPFWRSLAQRHIGTVSLRSGKRKYLRQVSAWLPALHTLHLEDWTDSSIDELKLFHQLQHLCITSCSAPLKSFDFLFPLSQHLSQLSICNVQYTCPSSHLLATISQLTRLTSLCLHHDGSQRFPAPCGVLKHLKELRHLSWTMITYRTLSPDFFSSTHLIDEHPTGLQLSDLQLLDYDATVTLEVLQPLSHLSSLSIFHLYSVPGPTCHLQTWLMALPHLRHLSVHADLQTVSLRAPQLETLHLEPWGPSSSLVRLLPQLFPYLKTLRIRHHHVPDEDFLQLQQLQYLDTLEILDSYHRPDPSDPAKVTYEPSPRLLQLTSDLQKHSSRRLRVLISSQRDPRSCYCVSDY
ncbi:uncharacterized protein ACBR49_014073 isoform 2-T2 [Aulostomus maculatus]